MDVQARARWEQYTKAKEAMLEHTHIPNRHGMWSRPLRQEEGAAELYLASPA